MGDTHRAVSLAGVCWLENGRCASFGSSRPGYGVEVTATGELLSRDGTAPSAWRLKSAAVEVAQYPPDWRTVRPAESA